MTSYFRQYHKSPQHVGRTQVIDCDGHFKLWASVFRGLGVWYCEEWGWLPAIDENEKLYTRYPTREAAEKAARHTPPVPELADIMGKGV